VTHSGASWGVALAIGLFVGGLSAWTYTTCHRDIEQARARVASGSRIAETACGPIEYAVVGDGPPLLAIHGAGGGYDQGLDLAGALPARGFRVIAVSRFGYLQTPLPDDATAAAQADAHACLLDALDIPRAAVLGASAGSPSSVQFALRHPDRVTALVLLVPALYVPRGEDAPSLRTPSGTEFLFDTALKSDFVFWAALRVARRTMLEAILATPPERVDEASAAEQARVAEILAHILPVSPRRLGLLNDASVTSSLERYPLERLTTPTLIVSAEDDLFGTYDVARYTAGQIPGARFIGYAEGGHILVGHHEDLMAEIEAALRKSQ
jgi:pimeloyl-ACP methyl ester carboxylesterase